MSGEKLKGPSRTSIWSNRHSNDDSIWKTLLNRSSILCRGRAARRVTTAYVTSHRGASYKILLHSGTFKKHLELSYDTLYTNTVQFEHSTWGASCTVFGYLPAHTGTPCLGGTYLGSLGNWSCRRLFFGPRYHSDEHSVAPWVVFLLLHLLLHLHVTKIVRMHLVSLHMQRPLMAEI